LALYPTELQAHKVITGISTLFVPKNSKNSEKNLIDCPI